MKRNSRLSLALHTLSHMASDPKRTRTSSDIAAHSGTNPVVVRRVLGKLREAGLVNSEKGHAGGWRLTKAPKDISFADVYLALEESLISSGPAEGSNCSVENALHKKVAHVMNEVEESLVQRLGETSIAEVRHS